MKSLLIYSWQKNHTSTSVTCTTVEALLERLKPAAELTDQALARLVLRLRARYPISLPLRADADVTTLVEWLTEAGAVVGVSASPPALKLSSAQPQPALAGTDAAAAESSAAQNGDD